ncbi:MAG TPA: SDR family oxidoreductase [Acidimicrobiia bacterium]|nr:SDR family oxidoreductase [Acidimicrobiia bacterium]
MAATVVIGGTSGLGKEVARHYAGAGHEVILSGRDPARSRSIAEEIGGNTTGIALDLTRPKELAGALSGVGPVKYLVLSAIDRDNNTIKEYNIEAAIGLVVSKLVGYSEVIHTLSDRLSESSSIVLFGGQARERPYPGSTTVTTINGGVTSMVKTLAVQLAPTRVNAIHPGIVGDSPYWSGKNLEGVIARTPGGKLATMEDITGAVVFLLENRGTNGVNLNVDGGWMLT